MDNIKVYVIRSLTKEFRYVGITNNIQKRLSQHNNGSNTSTKNYKPFKLIFTEDFDSYSEARKREIFLKSGKGREFLNKLEE
jgi:putative endonuclease